MAEAADDNGTIWRWMIDELEFVAKLLRGSENQAKTVLEDALDERVLLWRCQQLLTEFNMLKPAVAAGVVGAHRVFWMRQADTTIDVDYPNHRAVRTGPPWFFRRGLPMSVKAPGNDDLDIEAVNFLYDEGPVFLPGEPRIKLTANLIRFQHGSVVCLCRRLGLLPPLQPFPDPAQAAPEPPEAASEEDPTPGPAAAPSGTTLPEPSAAGTMGPPNSLAGSSSGAAGSPGTDPDAEYADHWQLVRALRTLRVLYPPDGKTPRGKGIEALRGEIDEHLEPENRNRGKASPGWDVVKQAVQIRGRRDN
jgi:hypothetical protein